MNPPKSYNPAEAARHLGVSSNTIRLWADRLGHHLSAGATSRPRTFTDTDLAALQWVTTLREANWSLEAIDERLAETTFQASEIVPPAPAETPGGPTEPSSDVQALILAMRALERRMTVQERSRQDYRSGLITGAILGMGGAAGWLAVGYWLGYLFAG